MDSDLKHWFGNTILPHQAALSRYLRRVCRSSSEVPDLLQETLARVYESATKSRPRCPKQFLFTTARNLWIDKLRRERVVSIDYTPETISLNVAIDELSPERRLAALQDLQQLTRAFESLPEKTRSVIWLRRVAGVSQREAAAILGIEESALEGHMTRGMRSLARALVVNGQGAKTRRENCVRREQRRESRVSSVATPVTEPAPLQSTLSDGSMLRLYIESQLS